MSKQTEKRKIEYIAIDALKEYERNTRTHSDEQVEQLKRSITAFGFTNPVLIDENNEIIAGHGRRAAARELGMSEVPCLRLIGLTEAQKKALRIADNQLALNAGWDEEMLRIELADLKTENFDLDLLGFSLDELEQYLGEDEEQKEVVEDESPAADEVKRRCKRGEIWQLGNHRLMCGDSTNADDVARLMDGEKADMVFTDPPYGYNYQSNMRIKTKKFDVLKNDDKVLNFFPLLSRFSDGFIFICTSWECLDKWLPLFQKYHSLSNMIIWNKGGGGIGDLKHTFLTDYEIILCSNCGHEIKGKRIGSVWDIGKDNANEYVHATQKPVALSALAITETTHQEDSVLDIFGGSGSTLIACEQLNRKCRMMELDEKYCDVIIQRWETLTGKTAKKIK